MSEAIVGLNPDFVARAQENNAARKKEERARARRLEALAREAGKTHREIPFIGPGANAADRLKGPDWVKDIVRAVAAKHKVHPLEIVGVARQKRVTAARHEVWYKVYAARPDTVTLPIIGRWFDRDHTTIGYGITRHGLLNNLPMFCNFEMART